ncbi:hypothetical protein FNW52_20440 [Flavobacterium sp. ZT3R18]|uniref:hypothetical protein n=1 Tax=Flavobacterium sp. ZT3R18 TaxID=2594429 RepID=UPI0011798DF8|nr:hypothetical protein [Flavobacterium sp. ZT3R18]TRX29914.1 hypothetical protein FNW52_20440 [Flavobacterium sp. ZT3R18]
MKKYFLIPQPPISEKLTFLVDEMNDHKTFGVTDDWDKFEYNLNLIGKDFKQDLEIGLSFLEKGITEVIDLGRYIAVVELKKDKSKGEINFFDTTIDLSREELYNRINIRYSKNIAEIFINIYDLMRSGSSPSFDNVELFLPLES